MNDSSRFQREKPAKQVQQPENSGSAQGDLNSPVPLAKGSNADLDGFAAPADQPVLAEVVAEPNRNRQTGRPGNMLPVDVAAEFQNMSAVGGAVGSLTLGIWSIVGSLLTPFSAINGLVALLLGIWGLNSRRRTMAIVGIVLSLVGMFFSLIGLDEKLLIWFG